jgi:RNA polymerase sigma factor (sigma-70 family)
MRYANNRDQAQDILQDGFVKVFQKMDHYRGDGPLGGWIARTMVNTALDHIRRNKPYDHSLGPYGSGTPAQPRTSMC